MQNKGKFYTFHLPPSYSNKKDNNRRVTAPKRLVHGSIIVLFLILGLSALGIGINGVISDSSIGTVKNLNPLLSEVSAQVSTGSDSIDYTRPAIADNYSINSGGPASSEADPESAEIEQRLQVIKTASDPDFVPSIWAHTGKINNEFGFRRNPFGGRTYEFHPGMDIDGERGDQVVATANGTVIKAGWTGGYGNMIEIDHGNGLTTRYGHMSKIEAEVGDTVTRGQLIGYVGSTGRSTGPHLHYELRLDDRPVNPRHFLPAEPTEVTKPD